MSYQDDAARRQREWQNNVAAQHYHNEQDRRRREESGGGGGFGAELIGGLIFIVLLIVALIWLVRIAAICLVAVVPMAALFWVYTRLMGGSESAGFWRILNVTFIGLFVYVAFTTMIALAVGPAQMGVMTGSFASLVNGVFELRKESLASLALVKPGNAESAALLGLLGAHIEPLSARLAAIAALHGPGLLMFAYALNRYLGAPYNGVAGFLIACVLVLITVPVCLGGLIWAVATH